MRHRARFDLVVDLLGRSIVQGLQGRLVPVIDLPRIYADAVVAEDPEHAGAGHRGAVHQLIVLDFGKRVVEMMQQPAPLIVALGSPEPDGVIFERSPRDQQEVAAASLQAPLEFMANVAIHARDDVLCRAEGGFEVGLETGFDVQ